MTKEEFLKGFVVLTSTFRTDFEKEVIDVYFRCLKDLTFQQFGIAVTRCCKELKFMPRPVEILERTAEQGKKSKDELRMERDSQIIKIVKTYRKHGVEFLEANVYGPERDGMGVYEVLDRDWA